MLPKTSLTILLAALLRDVACSSSPEVYVPGQKVTYHGSITGSDATKFEHFQGIPYAQDTSGKRRFAQPEPFVPEENGIIDASKPGALCPQTEAPFPMLFDATPEMSEDCLSLRIARPAGITAESKLPVVVWIHGGGVIKGSAYDSHFDPDNFLQLAIQEGTPVIYAAINYRMTIFGFPRLELLKDQKSLNLGLRDQRLALEWIKDNIEAFGGDAERFTVYGLSAGGTFAGLHTMAYGGEKGVPFQQAWMMSGPPGTAMNMTADATTIHTKSVAKQLKCGDSSASDAELLDCLRALPTKDVLDAAMSYSQANHPPAGVFTFIPSVDGDFFPAQQSHLIHDGKFVKGIPMVFGWTSDDGALNVGNALAVQSEEDMIGPIKAFASELSPDELQTLFDLYPPSSFQPGLDNYNARKSESDPEISIHFFRVSRIIRDLLFTCGSIDFGYEMYKQSRQVQPNFDNVRLYQLNQSVFTPIMAAAGMPFLGAIHGSDTPYIFNNFPEGKFSEEDQELATELSRSLIRFAYTGDPTEKNSAWEWPAAYTSIAEEAGLPEFNVEVIGGPYGTGPVLVKGSSSYKFQAQEVLNDAMEFAGMGSAAESTRARLIEADDLRERCTYLSSLGESLGR